MAVAAALYEEMVYDSDGVPRTANFADYSLVSAAELPSSRPRRWRRLRHSTRSA